MTHDTISRSMPGRSKLNVLVTGATGFVGSHALAALQALDGVIPIVLARDPKRVNPDFQGEVRVGDIRDIAFVRSALKDVEAVCMATAWTSVWGHSEQSRQYFLEPTLAFLDAAVEQGVTRIVFPSSVTAGVLRRLRYSAVRGKSDHIWPHLTNVVRIEDRMEALATGNTSTVVMRFGHFVGERYGLGLLPLLLPRLRTHFVPWVDKGRTTLPLIAGSDIGRAMALAAISSRIPGFAAIDVVGKELPTTREVFRFLKDAYGYPLPHFGVSFPMAYAFARFMELVSKLTPWDPFIARSIILLLEQTAPNNETARRLLGYEPQVHWKDAVRTQLAEMRRDRVTGLPMVQRAPQQMLAAEV
jgi:nucleoside-diphosphate-sugar epimerase